MSKCVLDDGRGRQERYESPGVALERQESLANDGHYVALWIDEETDE